MPNEDNQRIAKNTLYLYIRLVFVLLVSLYTSRVVLNTLGIVDYGIYNVVAGFVSMFALLSASLTNSSQRFYNYEKGKNGLEGMQRVFVAAHCIQLVMVVLILLLSETLGLWYVTTKMVYPPERSTAVLVVYQASILSLLCVVLQIPYSAAIIAHERINFYAFVGVLDVILKLIIALIVPLFGIDTLSIYGVLIAGVAFIDYLAYFVYSKRNFPYLKFFNGYDKDTFVNMLTFSGWSTLNAFSQTIKNQGLNLLMNFFFGPIVNAARGISFQVKSALLGFVMNITTAAQPQIIESYAENNFDRSKQLMYTISKLIFISLFIVALPIMFEVGIILRLWLGDDIPQYTEIFTILVLVITMVDILSTPISMIVSASGRIGLYNFCNSLLGIAVLPIACMFLKYGANPVSVYLVSLLISMIGFVSCLIIMQKVVNVRMKEYIQSVLLPIMMVVLTSIVVPWIITITMSESLIRLLVVVITTGVFTLGSGYFLGLNANERNLIVSYIVKLLSKFR